MQILYEHKQSGTVMMLLMLVPVVILLAVAAIPGSRPPWALVIGIEAILLGVMLLFSSLTVRVDAQHVRFYFGLGAFRHSFRVQRIRSVEVVRNPIWYGIGIHFIPGGMLYNVSGLDAVELTLENGRVIRIGSDEADDLAEAIESARRLPVPAR